MTTSRDRWRRMMLWLEVCPGLSAGDRMVAGILAAQGFYAEETGDGLRAGAIYSQALQYVGCTPTEPDDVRRLDVFGTASPAHRMAHIGAMLDGCDRSGLYAYVGSRA